MEPRHVDPCTSVLCMTTATQQCPASILKRGHEEITHSLHFSGHLSQKVVISTSSLHNSSGSGGSDLYGLQWHQSPRKTEACSAVTGTFGSLRLQESRQGPIFWTELVNAEYDWNKDRAESPLCVFEEDMKLSWYFNLLPGLPLLPGEPESNKTKRQYLRV